MKFDELNLAEAALLHDRIYEVDGKRLSFQQLEAVFKELPEDLLEGPIDRAWSEGFALWYRANRKQIRLPEEKEKRTALFREAIGSAFSVRTEELDGPLRVPSDRTFEEVLSECNKLNAQWTCIRRKSYADDSFHWEFCCSSFPDHSRDLPSYFLYIDVRADKAEDLFKKHDL